MRARQNLIELFSTFLQFESNRFSGWVTDAKLHRSIKACLNHFSEAKVSDDFWAVYWHKQTQKSEKPEVALGHMSAYLQEACYWTVQKMMLRSQQSYDRVPDLFQVAIASVPKILKSCNPDVSGSVKAYASIAFGNIIRDYLKQTKEADFCNNWALLLKTSRKLLTESLQNAGFDTATRERYLLAWTCFESIYLSRKNPRLRQTAAPDSATWQAIAAAYNHMRHQLSSPGGECSQETMERWLIECGNQVRKYLYPAVKSLNAPKPGYEEGELQDELVDNFQESLLTEWIQEEEQAARLEQKKQINTILTEAIAKLDATSQQLLQLYYQKTLTQQQIAQELAIQQYTVSRRLSKTRESLLLTLTRWSQQTLHISVTSDVVKYISTVLEEWLQAHYHRE
ncbi:sigma-70 family RNA polymerase sigma factor [Calothrix sp. UHCC 0171]|uniref:sigma-70 family RNA polymerase sigma factor n=1 Tax=Calothrix sp. UHCC 0171 TaxID=3110245 RepID=UPI002B21115F|nr:sigma-70 family RNA polymerase sigma factor [Calothrix sp. UHCC 0171]MEA5570509.1 sigma-70 family RNA polymerase sigma factor [Calothrix sp. UHCC 0171]